MCGIASAIIMNGVKVMLFDVVVVLLPSVSNWCYKNKAHRNLDSLPPKNFKEATKTTISKCLSSVLY
jgi:hypothetical protein